MKTSKQFNLTLITEIGVERFSELAENLGIEYKTTARHYYGVCPIHLGDNRTAWNLYRTGKSYIGNWICNSNKCHKKYGSSFINFIQAVKQCTFIEAVIYVKTTLNISDKEAYGEVCVGNQEKKEFIRNVNAIQKTTTSKPTEISKEKIQASLNIPSSYFLSRGYSADILIKHDVGDCVTEGKAMRNRAVVPIYNEYGNYNGCTGRSIYEKCSKCGWFHYPTAPVCMETPKWKNSSDLHKSENLYNIHNSKSLIMQTETAIILEGAADLWKLEEAGFYNGLALLGSEFSDSQSVRLAQTGALNLVILTDNDNAGVGCADSIRKRCERTYRLYFPYIPKHDIGECTAEEIREILKDIPCL